MRGIPANPSRLPPGKPRSTISWSCNTRRWIRPRESARSIGSRRSCPKNSPSFIWFIPMCWWPSPRQCGTRCPRRCRRIFIGISKTFRWPRPHQGGRISPLTPVLSTDLSVDYPQKTGVLQGARVEVLPGEIVGLVGQSGSGKSTLALAILRLLDHTGARIRGRMTLLGQDLMSLREPQLRAIRGRLVSLIPQSPAAALNPALRVGTQLREAWRAHSSEPWPVQRDCVVRLLAAAGLSPAEEFLKRFPREISVGQAQRILIVMALLHSPAL